MAVETVLSTVSETRSCAAHRCLLLALQAVALHYWLSKVRVLNSNSKYTSGFPLYFTRATSQ